MDGDDKKKGKRVQEREIDSENPANNDEENNVEEDDESEANMPPGLHGEEELDQIYSQRGAEDEAEEAEAPTEAPVAEGRERRGGAPARRGQYRNSKDVMLGDVSDRLQRANERLRAQLNGSVLIEVSEPEAKYLLKGADTGLSLDALEGNGANAADCKVRIRQSDLLRVASGELNPQVAMLSDRISVEGQVGLAVYLFNLIAPN